MRELVRKTKVISESLAKLSKDIEIGGSTVASSSEEIATSVTSVSQEGIKQAEALEDAVSLLESFSVDLDNVDNKLTLLADGGKVIKEDTNKGVETINKLANTIDDMLNSFSVSRAKVENLDSTISQINSIVDVINGVAKQTNLLALNASIEAAEQGGWKRILSSGRRNTKACRRSIKFIKKHNSINKYSYERDSRCF